MRMISPWPAPPARGGDLCLLRQAPREALGLCGQASPWGRSFGTFKPQRVCRRRLLTTRLRGGRTGKAVAPTSHSLRNLFIGEVEGTVACPVKAIAEFCSVSSTQPACFVHGLSTSPCKAWPHAKCTGLVGGALTRLCTQAVKLCAHHVVALLS